VFLDKDRTMDNVQQHNICTNEPLSQTFNLVVNVLVHEYYHTEFYCSRMWQRFVSITNVTVVNFILYVFNHDNISCSTMRPQIFLLLKNVIPTMFLVLECGQHKCSCWRICLFNCFLFNNAATENFLVDEYYISIFPVDEYGITVCRVHRCDHRHLVFFHKFGKSKFILDNGCKKQISEYCSVCLMKHN
jgi:hypothetical protein